MVKKVDSVLLDYAPYRKNIENLWVDHCLERLNDPERFLGPFETWFRITFNCVVIRKSKKEGTRGGLWKAIAFENKHDALMFSIKMS